MEFVLLLNCIALWRQVFLMISNLSVSLMKNIRKFLHKLNVLTVMKGDLM